MVSPKALPPTLSERFELVRTLGVGGASAVYLVNDKTRPDSEPIALKLLDAHGLDPDNLIRFKKEFEILKTLRHPNLIQAFELIEAPQAAGYLMEYVDGKNLLEILRIKRPSYREIDLIFSQLLGALFELHQHGLAHRDIKLENVLIRNDGFVKLSDLGLMKQLKGVSNTETGVLLGTSQYLPPEYVKHSLYDSRSDIYTLGLMLFECIAGKRWLEGKSGAEAVRYLCEINFEFPKLALAGLPNKYQRILTTALAVQPWKRYASAEIMRRAVLSEQGDPEPTQTMEVAHHLNLHAFEARRRTTELISIRERRKKIMVGMVGVVAAAAVTVAIGMASSLTKSTVAPTNDLQRALAPNVPGMAPAKPEALLTPLKKGSATKFKKATTQKSVQDTRIKK